MAETAVPRFDKLLWPTLLALREIGGSGTVSETSDKAIEIGGYGEEQQEVLHKGGPSTEIRYRLAWARSYLKAVGALENSVRGVWSITEYGRSLQESDMATIPPQVRSMKRAVDGSAAVETVAVTYEVGPIISEGEAWQDQLLTVLQALPPDKFENLCQRLLRESGFTQVEVTEKTGDGGIDGIGVLRIALLSFQVVFQCKRYKSTVSASDVRDFRGAMVGRTDKGLLITTGTFTADAKKEARRDGAPALDLIDGELLCQLLREQHLGVETRLVEEVLIDSPWFERL